MQNTINLKFPVILVHGLGLRDDMKLVKYWGKIPEKLKKNGIQVFLSNQLAFHTIEFNAILIKNRINQILNESGSEKINIIAHSKGGIESRYMISKLDMSGKVASLTTISSPHRGSSLADLVLEKTAKKKVFKFSEKIIKAIAEWQGDNSPEIIPAFKQMTLAAMADFNKKITDVPEVYYQSYGGIVSGKPYGRWTDFKTKIIQEREGINDGVVSQYSFEWSNFKGVVMSDSGKGVSHHEIIGMTSLSDFDAPAFFVRIVKELADLGY